VLPCAVWLSGSWCLQEYNICFTTVKRPTDGSMPALPTAANGAGGGSSSGVLAPLPTVIQGLVRKRREVKTQMKTCRCVWGGGECKTVGG